MGTPIPDHIRQLLYCKSMHVEVPCQGERKGLTLKFKRPGADEEIRLSGILQQVIAIISPERQESDEDKAKFTPEEVLAISKLGPGLIRQCTQALASHLKGGFPEGEQWVQFEMTSEEILSAFGYVDVISLLTDFISACQAPEEKKRQPEDTEQPPEREAA